LRKAWRTGSAAIRIWVLLCVLTGTGSLGSVALAQKIGTDIAGLNLCLYGDCEARGAYAADPFGWANPGTLPVLALPYLPRGVLLSPGYFRLTAGGVGIDVETGTVTVAADPWLFQINAIYAEGAGAVRSMPGVDLSLRTRNVRLAAAIDLGRSALHLSGLSMGLLFGVPVMGSDLHLTAGGFTLVDSREDHEIELTPGIHWRGGEREWFGVGAVMTAVSNHVTASLTDPASLITTQQRGTSNAWFPRVGVSILPSVPFGLAEQSSPVGELLGELRLAADVEHQNISVPGEGTRRRDTGYFGVDARLLPDAWNPVSDYLRVNVIAGVDTEAGWGLGAGLWGNGAWEFLSCNPAYSSRPRAKSLGDRVDVWSATCSAVVPF
jgi:hypothetical protein